MILTVLQEHRAKQNISIAVERFIILFLSSHLFLLQKLYYRAAYLIFGTASEFTNKTRR
jgi:hypothetical protein